MTEREQIEMDVVFVGAGPANLAAALSLKKEIAEHDDLVEKGIRPGRKIGDLEIAIVEKGPFVGAHILSGAVMDPVAMRELMPDLLLRAAPSILSLRKMRFGISLTAARSNRPSLRLRSKTKANTSSASAASANGSAKNAKRPE